jgi:hypothetical protein
VNRIIDDTPHASAAGFTKGSRDVNTKNGAVIDKSGIAFPVAMRIDSAPRSARIEPMLKLN